MKIVVVRGSLQHRVQFKVSTGAVPRGPAKNALQTCTVTIEAEIRHIDVPLALAVQGV